MATGLRRFTCITLECDFVVTVVIYSSYTSVASFVNSISIFCNFPIFWKEEMMDVPRDVSYQRPLPTFAVVSTQPPKSSFILPITLLNVSKVLFFFQEAVEPS